MAPRVVTPSRRHGRSDGSATAGREHRRLHHVDRAAHDRCTEARHRV